MEFIRFTILFAMVLCAHADLIYNDTGLASKLVSTASNTTDAMFITIYSKAPQDSPYDQLLYAEGNNGSDVRTLYYVRQDDAVFLESHHQQTNYSRIVWNLESTGHEKLILVVGTDYLQLLANCDIMLESYEATVQNDLLAFLRNPDLETIYAEEVEIGVYSSEPEAMAAQCVSSYENLQLPENVV